MGSSSEKENAAQTQLRKVGFDRYREVLEHNWKNFFFVHLLTLAGLIPLVIGIAFSVMSSSVLLLIIACVIGGIFAGPAISGMTDCIFRALRDCRDDWWVSYKRQFRQNFKCSVIPGIIFSLFVGFAVFMGIMMYFWSETVPSAGTAALFVLSLVIAAMLFSVYFPQLVLFNQNAFIRLKNCLLFCIKYFWRVLGSAVLQTVWWIAAALFMPWTAFLVPLIGVWYIMFLGFFILYRPLNNAFNIEKSIEEQFPGQIEHKNEI